MRNAARAVLSLAGLFLAGCMTTSPTYPERVQTTEEAEKENVQGAVSAPLRDFNVLRTKIPPILLEAMADPYNRPPPNFTCNQLQTLVEPLDIALGPDLDVPDKKDEGLKQKGRGATLGAVAGATSGVIPFHSWIRKLTGAERHDDFVQDAIKAGSVRRAYLKGLGEASDCPPPVIPSHIMAGRPTPDQSMKPRYPTRLPPGGQLPGEAPKGEPPR
jgi:hypothetical protein